MHRRCLFAVSLAGIASLVATSRAAEVTVVLDNLDTPCGVAIQPSTGDVFISESGAGRVVRWVSGKVEEVVVGFGREDYAGYRIGPLGLAFLNQTTLAVGGGDLPRGEERLRLFSVPPSGSAPIAVKAALISLQLPLVNGLPGEGNFFGVATTRNAVFVTCQGDDSKGWLARATIRVGQLASFERFIGTKQTARVDTPAAVTISPRGEIVVGHRGETGDARDSAVSYFNANTGKPLLSLPAGLFDISGLAFSPNGQLYATDLASTQNSEGGLFQLIAQLTDGRQTLTARKATPLDKPSAMAFAKDGTLYVTLLGSKPAEANSRPSGKLVRVAL